MTNVKNGVMVMIFVSVLAAGCSKDGEVNSFVEANDALVTALTATTTSNDARAEFNSRKEALTQLFSGIQSARNFQVSDESRQRLTESVTRGVLAICGLRSRGLFDAEKASAYEAICEEYANLYGASVPPSGLTAEEQLARGLARDLEDARAEARDGASLTMYSCVSRGQYETGLANASDGDLQAALTEYRRLCTLDGPLARMEHAVHAAEEARAANPSARVLSQCFSAHWDSSSEAVRAGEGASDPRVAGLEARWNSACP